MSPGGAIFFLPTHPKERAFLPLSPGNLWCILPLSGNSIWLPGKEVHGWWWSVRLRDFRGCCKPAVSGLGGYRPGLPEERDGGNPASRLSPATGSQSSTRFEGHVWRSPGPPKKGTQGGPECWGRGGVVPEGDPSAAGPLPSPGVPRCLRGVEVRRALRGQWLTGLGAHHKSKWLRDSVTQKQAVTSSERGWEGLGEGLSKERVLAREPSSWL